MKKEEGADQRESLKQTENDGGRERARRRGGVHFLTFFMLHASREDSSREREREETDEATPPHSEDGERRERAAEGGEREESRAAGHKAGRQGRTLLLSLPAPTSPLLYTLSHARARPRWEAREGGRATSKRTSKGKYPARGVPDLAGLPVMRWD